MTALAIVVPTFASGTGSAAAAAKSSKSLTTVTLEIPNVGATFLPFFLGIQDGIYKKYGINLTIDSAISPPLAVQSILSGKLDFMAAIGTAGSAGLHGEPMRVYDVTADGIDFVMLAGKGITKMSELAGKTIVGESATAQINLMEALMLKHAGITPNAVSFVNVTGGDAARAALVLAGKAQGVTAEYNNALTEEGQGLHIIGNTSFVLEPFTGLATSTTFANSHKSLVKAMIEATTKATNIARTNGAKAVKVLRSKPLTTSAANAKKVWKYLKNEWLSGPVPPKAAVDNQLAAWKTQYKLTSTPTMDKSFDFSIAKSVTKKKG